MRIARQKPQHFRYRPRQLAFAGDLLREILQLLRVWQLTVEQQVSDLLESGLLSHLMNVVAPIHQPGSGSTQQIAVSPAITPASPRLNCGFVSVPMVFADCNYDTRADKSSVAQAQPFLCSWIVVEQFV